MKELRLKRLLTSIFILSFLTGVSLARAGTTEILYISNGYYDEEDALEDHLTGYDFFNVTKLKSYQISGSTDLSPYDIVILTGFAPKVSTSALNNISDSKIPLLIVEYWDFTYSHLLGLTDSDWAMFGDNVVEVTDRRHPITNLFDEQLEVYEPEYYAFGVTEFDVKDGILKAMVGPTWNQVSVLVDEQRKIIATGLNRMDRYTTESWALFDLMLNYLHTIGPKWADSEAARQDFYSSDLRFYLEQIAADPDAYDWNDVRLYFWTQMLGRNYFDITEDITLEAKKIFDVYPASSSIFYAVFPFAPFKLFVANTNHENRHSYFCDIDDGLYDIGCVYDRLFVGQNFDPSEEEGHRAVSAGPWKEAFIAGSDMGANVAFGDQTFFYMGDTHGCPSLRSCGDPDVTSQWGYTDRNEYREIRKLYFKYCNDAIVTTERLETLQSETSIFNNGIDSIVMIEKMEKYWSDYISEMETLCAGDSSECDEARKAAHRKYGFRPLVVDGINGGTNVAPPSEMGFYAVPSGAEVLNDKVVLWYSSTMNTSSKDKGGSWLACSRDGFQFTRCPGWETKKFSPGSDTFQHNKQPRFMSVAPVRIAASLLENEICAEGSKHGLAGICNFAKDDDKFRNGLLLYGTSGPYRCGGLFMAFLNYAYEVKYYTGSGWSDNELEAAPLIETTTENRCTHNSYKKTGDTNPHMRWNRDDPTKAFGELSVKMVEFNGVQYLVMLTNHMDFSDNLAADPSDPAKRCLSVPCRTFGIDCVYGKGIRLEYCRMGTPVQMRLALLNDPATWSPPRDTMADGYAPYIIDGDYVIEGDYELMMYHLISSWKGGMIDPYDNLETNADTCLPPVNKKQTEHMSIYQDEPYGVFTTELRMADGGLPYFCDPAWGLASAACP